MDLPGRYVDFRTLFPPLLQQEIQLRFRIRFSLRAAKGSMVQYFFNASTEIVVVEHHPSKREGGSVVLYYWCCAQYSYTRCDRQMLSCFQLVQLRPPAIHLFSHCNSLNKEFTGSQLSHCII